MRLGWAVKEADKQQHDDYEGIFDYNYANEEVEHEDDYEDDEDDGNVDGVSVATAPRPPTRPQIQQPAGITPTTSTGGAPSELPSSSSSSSS
jgi:hypothetical protein